MYDFEAKSNEFDVFRIVFGETLETDGRGMLTKYQDGEEDMNYRWYFKDDEDLVIHEVGDKSKVVYVFRKGCFS